MPFLELSSLPTASPPNPLHPAPALITKQHQAKPKGHVVETRQNDFSQSQRGKLPRSSETLIPCSFLSSERTAYLLAENQMHKCINKAVVTDEIWQAGNGVSTEVGDGQFCFQMIQVKRRKMP